ncbi:hypothetical protein HPC38_09810 [Pasteurellaceae bacterium HPA106]|uniref:hypothetical protein n=1 Tax=Spirabiliibacterium pneumoniae TaxID=221400 RepID=UPI001AAD2AA2|nr:hypothetical protein [Spirabiliibacterium pneumoniae]MBE2897159.1 hypothetical protein [Spirabiliibacterium pneumoniae]
MKKKLFSFLNIIFTVIIFKILGVAPALLAIFTYHLLEKKYGAVYAFIISTIIGVGSGIILAKFIYNYY